MGGHEVAGKGYVFTKTSQMASIGVVFTSTYHTKQLNPWPNPWQNSSASHVVNYSQLSACQGDMQPFEGDPYTLGRLKSLRNKPQQKHPGKLSTHQYLAELLVNVYSYCLMVKVCLAIVCVEAVFSQIWSHIISAMYGLSFS